MESLVWDRYKNDVRITLTVLLVALAIAVSLVGLAGWATIPLLGAAVAFHAENKLILYPESRTYEKRVLLKPFGQPIKGSLAEFECIRLYTWTSEYSSGCGAALVLPRGKFE